MRYPDGWLSGFCKTGEINIHYLRNGGALPPLIGLHGLLGSGACLVPLARTLVDAFDVILPDARGHGGSSAPPGGYSYDDLANDVIGLMEKLSLRAPALLGHSMGGMTAALVASRLGSAISSLVLVDPTFISPEWQREVFEGNIAEEHRHMLASPRSDLLAQARVRAPHRQVLEALVDARLHTSMAAFEVLTPPNPDFRKITASIRTPILLITADKGVVTPKIVHELQSLNPLLQHGQIHDSGHGIPYDQPELLGAAIRPFLWIHASAAW